MDTCRRVLLRGMPAHLLFSAAGVGGPPQKQHVLAQGQLAEHALCSLRVKASPRDSPPWRIKAEPSGSEVFRLVSWRPCVSRVSAAPEVDRRFSEDCVADRRTKRHIGCPGELELICHSVIQADKGGTRAWVWQLEVSRYDPHTFDMLEDVVLVICPLLVESVVVWPGASSNAGAIPFSSSNPWCM